MSQEPIFAGAGYIYKNGKAAGHGIKVAFDDQALYVFSARAQAAGAALGALGRTVGSAIDSSSKGAELAVAYTDIASAKIHKSLLNGAGIEFVLSDGTKFKIATQTMAMGGVKKIFPTIATAIRQANPNVALDPAV